MFAKNYPVKQSVCFLEPTNENGSTFKFHVVEIENGVLEFILRKMGSYVGCQSGGTGAVVEAP